MDPRMMALMQMLQGNQAQGPAGPGMPQASPGVPMSQPAASNPMAPPTGAQMAPGGQTLGPPKSPPGPLLAAAGMQPQPNSTAPTAMRGPEIPQRQGDMMGPVHPTYDEPTTPIAPPIRNAIPPMPRTPLGALLIPGVISGM
jgi:hypothetical protein